MLNPKSCQATDHHLMATLKSLTLLLVLFAIVPQSHAATVTWTGANTTWTQPDSDSFGGDTYNSGDTVNFTDTGVGSVVVSGGVNPAAVNVSNTAGTYAFTGGGINDGTLSKSGAGTLTLSGTNTYTGATVISGGTLQYGLSSNLPSSSAVTISNNAKLKITAIIQFANSVFIAAGQSGTIEFSGTTDRIQGNYSGMAGTLNADRSAGGILWINSNTGPALGSVFNVIGSSARTDLNNVAYADFFANTTLRYDSGVNSAYALNMGNGDTAALNVKIGALDGGASGTRISSDNRGNRTLTITGAANGNFAGSIINGAGSGPMITLVKNGPGTQKFTGDNTYTGTTMVNGGTLWLDGTSSGFSHTGAGAYTVNGGTLKGDGNLTGHAVTFNSGSTGAPGNSPGLMTTGSQTWNNGSTYEWEVAGPGLAGTAYDTYDVTGLLTFSAPDNGITLELIKFPGSAIHSGDLFALWTYNDLAGWDVGANLASNLFTFVSVNGINIDNAYVYATTGNGEGPGTIFLTGITYTPEPSSLFLAAVGLVGLALSRRRRRRSC